MTAAETLPRWPGDSRAACAFTFDLDAETLWMARGVHEPVTLSQGRFGPVEALPRILAMLEKAEAAFKEAGKPDRLEIYVAMGKGHTVTESQKKAVVEWFARWLE